MFDSVENDGTGADDALTVEDASSVFESLLSEPSEDRKEHETPPAHESPAPEPDPEAAEPAEEEGESEAPDETDEPPAEQSETHALDPAMKVKVKVDGQEIETTLDEVLKGYSRTQDYTRKTQEVAEQRKAAEAEKASLAGERARAAEYLRLLEQTIQDATPKEPDWQALLAEDPAKYAAERLAWDAHHKEMAELRKQREVADAQVAQDIAQRYQATLDSEREKLVAAIPEWKDTEVAKADKSKLRDYASKAGFSDDDLNQVSDHRLMVMLRKAMLWDEAQAKKPAIQARIEKVKTATPGPAASAKTPVSDSTRALQRLVKTGKQQDAAAFFETLL